MEAVLRGETSPRTAIEEKVSILLKWLTVSQWVSRSFLEKPNRSVQSPAVTLAS